MGLVAALMTYLVVAALLVGGMVTSFVVFFSQPSETSLSEKLRPPLVRAAERKVPEVPKVPEMPKAFAPAVSAANTIGPAINLMPADPRLNSAAQAKQQASLSGRKKKVVKPVPREPETTTLGYGPSEPRRFIFPLDPGW